MTTIRRTTTLFEYDGPQLFEAHGDDGSQYLSLLVGSEEKEDRYLVVRVDPGILDQFREGAIELRSLLELAGTEQWFLAYSSNLDEPLVLEVQSPPIAERFLPDEGFILADADVPLPDTERTFSPPIHSAQVREHMRTDLQGAVAPTSSGLITKPIASKNHMIRIKEIDLRIQNMRTRMPFKFGISTMTAVPHLVLGMVLEVDGRTGRGYSADHLPPKWFTKNPETSLEDEVGDMISVIRHAGDAALAIGPAPDLFTLWQELYRAQKPWGTERGFAPLLWGLGVSLVERAMIEAYCRLMGTNFGQAVRSNAFGLRFGALNGDLQDLEPADVLPASPITNTNVRHTVGLGDPLTTPDIPTEELCDDGLPQSLDEVIDTYGVTYFKIKLFGDEDRDFSRLKQTAAVIEGRLNHYAFTLDGNENYGDMASFRSFWEALRADRHLEGFLRRLICIEQPLHRNIALDEEVRRHFDAWTDRPPFIIDESDGDLGDVQRAVEIGYAGTSFKNCKGVFKGLSNAAYLKYQSTQNPERAFVLTSEDLSNIAPIALAQDLAVLATLGVDHTERNSHHYFKGLTVWSEDIQEKVLENHPELFSMHKDGFPFMDIQKGRINMKSVTTSPFGIGFEFDSSKLTPLDNWTYATLEDG